MGNLKETGSINLLTSHLRNVYTGQDARVGTMHVTIDQFKSGKGE